MVNSWRPPEPVRLIVAVAREAADTAEVLHEADLPRGGRLDWGAVPAVQSVRLQPGDRLAIRGWNTGGGTCTIDLARPGQEPVTIRLAP